MGAKLFLLSLEQMARNGGIINQILVLPALRSAVRQDLRQHRCERNRAPPLAGWVVCAFFPRSSWFRWLTTKGGGNWGWGLWFGTGFLPGRVRKRELNYCFVLQRRGENRQVEGNPEVEDFSNGTSRLSALGSAWVHLGLAG